MIIKHSASVMLFSLLYGLCATVSSAGPSETPTAKIPTTARADKEPNRTGDLAEDGNSAEEGARFFPEGTTHDFGPVRKGTQAVHRFRLVNLSNLPLKVESIRVSMAPLTLGMTNYELKPNQEENLSVTMDTRRFNGFRSVSIYVDLNCNGKRTETVLNVAANSREDLNFLPLEFGSIKRGSGISTRTDVSFLGHLKLRVTAAACESNIVHVEFKELVRNEAKTVYQIQATTRTDIPEGKWTTEVQLVTNDPIMPKIVVPVTVEVQP